jgi:disulfide bond formation protein DsbB
MKLNTRLLFLLMFIACVLLLGYALTLQMTQHLLPCPLCVGQRIAYWLVGLTALFAYIHFPVAPRWYAGALAAFSLAGAAVALHHVWVIAHPADAGCGISPEEKFLNALPLAHWWPAMFEANGDCAKVTWRFLSLGMADWSLICFLALFGCAIYILLRAKESARSIP